MTQLCKQNVFLEPLTYVLIDTWNFFTIYWNLLQLRARWKSNLKFHTTKICFYQAYLKEKIKKLGILHLGTKLSSLSLGLRPTISIQNFRVVTVIPQSQFCFETLTYRYIWSKSKRFLIEIFCFRPPTLRLWRNVKTTYCAELLCYYHYFC